jgi:hypothetical protein
MAAMINMLSYYSAVLITTTKIFKAKAPGMGATTLSKMTFSITTLGMMTFRIIINKTRLSAEWKIVVMLSHLCRVSLMLIVTCKAFMLIIVMLSVV